MMIDPNFIMIDLRTQYEAFTNYVDGWSIPEILGWLSRYGQVKVIDEHEKYPTYFFMSVSGLPGAFWANDAGKIVISGYRSGSKTLYVNAEDL